MQAQPFGLLLGFAWLGAFRVSAQAREGKGEENADGAVGDDQWSVHVRLRRGLVHEMLANKTTDQCPDSGCNGANEVVPCENAGTLLIGDCL